MPADSVPDEYPWRVDARDALALEVALGDGAAADGGDAEAVPAFETWPSGGHAGSRVARLLDAAADGATDPAALAGERVVLEARDGHYRVDVAATRGDRERAAAASADAHSLTEVAVAVGALAGFAGGFLAIAWSLAAGSVALAAAAATLAASLGVDARHTAGESWRPRATAWAAGGAVPVVNVAVGVAYLVRKAVAVSDPDHADRVWRDVLVADAALFAVALAAAAVGPLSAAAVAVFAHAWVLAPVAVLLDGRSARHERGPPNRLAWVAGAAVLGGAGALVYLLRTDGV